MGIIAPETKDGPRDNVDHLACTEILVPIEHYRVGLLTANEMRDRIHLALLALRAAGTPGHDLDLPLVNRFGDRISRSELTGEK
jgi:hypothetical protein